MTALGLRARLGLFVCIAIFASGYYHWLASHYLPGQAERAQSYTCMFFVSGATQDMFLMDLRGGEWWKGGGRNFAYASECNKLQPPGTPLCGQEY
jgi:hypothetical protein